MLGKANHIWLGAEAASDTATVSFVDASLTPHDSTEAIDPSTFSDHWSWTADYTAGTLTLTDDTDDTTLLEHSHGSGLTLGPDINIAGSLSGVEITDEMVRLSAFANGATNVTVRATSTDFDEIFEFDRNSNSDYNMYLHRGGSRTEVMTDSHDILREQDNPYSDVADSGTTILPGPDTLNFGTDLGVTDNGDNSVTIDYTGGDVPAPVHDDGTEVLANADGLDFASGLSVSSDANNFAVIDFTADILEPDVAETITADWALNGNHTFGGSVTFDNQITGSIDHAVSADSATNADLATDSDNLGGNGPGYYAALSEAETITNNWTHESPITLAADNALEWGGGTWIAWHSTSNGNLYIEDTSSGSAVGIMTLSSTGANFPQGASVGGNPVATEPWVSSNYNYYSNADAISAINNDADHGSTASHNYYTDADAQAAINNDADHGSTASHNYFSGSHADLTNVGSSDHHAKYTDSEARTAVDGSNVSVASATDADKVDGYDIYVQSTAPSTSDPYIRLEPQ